MSKELEKAAEEYSINGDYQFMSTFQQMAQKAFIAGATWQASNTIILNNMNIYTSYLANLKKLEKANIRPSDFCHRHLVSKWLCDNGYEVSEYTEKDTELTFF